MDTALLLARLVLSAVFLVAGFAKLVDREGSRQGLEGFGIPKAAAQPVSVLLPLAEIAVAILLLPTATAWWGAIGAAVLLGLFIAGIGYNLAKGNHPDCHCFGQLHSEPAGWPTLIRNGILEAVALFIVFFGRDIFSFSNEDAGYSLVAWIGNLSTWELIATILGVIALAAIVIEGWLLVHLLGQNGRVLLRLDAIETMAAEGGLLDLEAPAAPAPAPRPLGLPEGSPAPAFRLEGLFGETMTLDALRAPGKPVMLVFSDPGCGPCNALLPDLGKWQREHAAKLTFALLSRGAAEANRAKATEHGLSHVLLQKDREVAQAYQANGTPSAVIVKSDGTIGSPVSAGAEAIKTLVSRTTGTLPLQAAPVVRAGGNGANGGAQAPAPVPQPPRPKVGDAAPAIELPDLEGKTVSLADFKGQKTLVLFWNPGCGFCRRMGDELKQWEAKPPKGAPKLLVVSTGTPEANKELGLSSPTVLDQGFTTGRAYGASGTPSAVLVDAQGKIASDIAVGQPGVMALATGKDPAKVDNGGGAAVKAAKKGDKAPAVKLKDLSGNAFDLATQKTDTLLVFWNPGCGFCRRMADDLKVREANPPDGGPQIVLVSSGTVEANQELGLASTTLLDEGFATGRAFGASGTPSAILIDKNGKIASEVGVGAPAVMELAGAPKAASV
jgi:peroxiredoxin